MKYRVVKN